MEKLARRDNGRFMTALGAVLSNGQTETGVGEFSNNVRARLNSDDFVELSNDEDEEREEKKEIVDK